MKDVQYQFIDQKYQKLADIESNRVNASMFRCLQGLQLEHEMNDPGLYSVLIKHGEHARKIVNAVARLLVSIDKKYLEECEKSFYQKIWKVRSKELEKSYRDDLLNFAAEIENSRTDNLLSLINAHIAKIQQLSDEDFTTDDQNIHTDKHNSGSNTFSAKKRNLNVTGENILRRVAENEGYELSQKDEDNKQKM